MIIRKRVLELNPSATLEINEQSQKLQDEGKKIFRFGFGQSPFPIPDFMQDKLCKNTHRKDYLPVQGLLELRRAIASFHRRKFNHDCSEHQVIIGPGSKELIFDILMILKGSLILPAPSWVSYAPQAKLIGKKVIWVPTNLANGYKITPGELELVCESLNTDQSILILNYPNNPTGVTYNREELVQLTWIAQKYNLWIISDEIYALLDHNDTHTSLASIYPDNTIVTSGISKCFGAGGWRLGYAIVPNKHPQLIKHWCDLAGETFTSVNAPVQYTAISVFADPQITEDYRTKSRLILEKIGSWCWKELIAHNIPTPKPNGGFYLFPNFKFSRPVLSGFRIGGSKDLCQWLLNDTNVALLPGAAFGRNPEEWTARLSYVDFNGREALNQPESEISQTGSEEWMKKWAPNVYEGVNLLLEKVH